MAIATTNHESQLIAQFNKLYITNRNPFLQMTKTGGYITVTNRSMADHDVLNHLRQKTTLGVCNKGTKAQDGTPVSRTKFLCFDCDGGDGRDKKNPLTADEKLSKAYDQAGSIRRVLISKYGIPAKDIHVSVSGGKGLHVDLFLSDAIKYTILEEFYKQVIADCGLTEGEVEFRPNGAGVKLPLGKNMKTKRLMVFCAYSDKFAISKSSAKGGTRHFKNMSLADSYKYFLRIEPMDLAWFTGAGGPLEIARGEAKLRKEAKRKLNLTDSEEKTYDEHYNKGDWSDKTPEERKEQLENILGMNHLDGYLKRHMTTYFLAMHLRSEGYNQETVEDVISEVISNTFANPDTRYCISEDTTLEFALSEVARLTKYVFDNDKEIHFTQKKITISRAEVLKILALKKPWERQMTLAFLIHEKKYAKEKGANFFLAYSDLRKYGCDTKPSRCKAQILELSETTGFVEPVSMGVKKDKWVDDNRIFETNIYRVQLLTEAEQKSEDNQLTMELDINKKLKFEEVVTQFISQDEAKALLTKSQYYKTYKQLYEATN